MKKIWLIASNTYSHRVRTGTFIFLTFALPLLMVAVGVFSVIFLVDEADLERVGYIDQTGQLAMVDRVELYGETLHMIELVDEEQAQAAFLNGSIEGYLLIPAGYFEGEPVTFYAEQAPGTNLRVALRQFMRQALFPEASESVIARVENPSEITYQSLRTGATVSSGIGLVVYFASPAILAVLFALAVVFMTGQLGSAIVREKEQRAMEMVVTSLRPRELVAGKVLGMALLALTQFAIWVGGAIIAISLFAPAEWNLLSVALPWRAIIWGLVLMVPGYFLYAMLGAGAGIIAGDSQQAQQMAAMAGLAGFIPIWILPMLLSQPDGPLAVGLTLFPLTAPSVALLRMSFGDVADWQLIAALIALLLGLWLATWVVARIFRGAMLIYGQTLRPRQIWTTLRRA
jgi:ABC-2 type transport system permease protein